MTSRSPRTSEKARRSRSGGGGVDHYMYRAGPSGHAEPDRHDDHGPPMETLINAPIEWAVAELAQQGQSESGDRHLVLPTPDGGLVAVVDGLGHGAEAASAAKVAVRALERGGDRPLAQLFRDCHQSLIGTRGAVISAASFSVPDETMTWLGVGNVEGRLLRAPVSGSPPPDALLVRGGVVGAHLPPLGAR